MAITAARTIKAFPGPLGADHHGTDPQQRGCHIEDGHTLPLIEAHIKKSVMDMATIRVHGAHVSSRYAADEQR